MMLTRLDKDIYVNGIAILEATSYEDADNLVTRVNTRVNEQHALIKELHASVRQLEAENAELRATHEALLLLGNDETTAPSHVCGICYHTFNEPCENYSACQETANTKTDHNATQPLPVDPDQEWLPAPSMHESGNNE